MNYNCVQGEMPSLTPESPTEPSTSTPLQKFINDMKKDVKVSIQFEESNTMYS